MRGNPFFTQERPGKNEKNFKLIKFRTMDNRKDKDGNLLPDEIRLNRYGRLLRKTSLDELPEAFNIIKGDMSFVGPRPLMARYLKYYSDEEKKRHDVRPGLTGYAQVHGRNNVNWNERLELDVFYVEHLTFYIDIKILLVTVFLVIKGEGTGNEHMENFDGYRKKQMDDNYETIEGYNSMELITPYYVIHRNELEENLAHLNSALRKFWDNYIIGYAYKTNALPWIISYFRDAGCFAEVASEEEMELAKLICVDKKKLIYNGPIKTKKSFLEALNNGSYVNIDSTREIEWLGDLAKGTYNLGIRVNFDIEKICPGQTQCGDEGGRFGFCYENGEFEAALKRIEQKGFKVNGIHLHVSSRTRGLDIYRMVAQMACEIADEFHMKFEFIDVGGGFYGGLPSKPNFEDYIKIMTQVLETKFDRRKTKLIVEPGMALIGSPVSYVTSVIDLKDTNYNRFVITDGSRTNIDPLMKKTVYFHEYIRIHQTHVIEKQIICGYTCMEQDRLFESINEQELRVGDKIVYNKVGAYTMCLTPLFIKYFPDVYVEENCVMKKVRKAWTPKEYIQNAVEY